MAERYYQVRPNGRLSGDVTQADIPEVHSSRVRGRRIGGGRFAATALVVCLLLTLVAWQVVALQVERAEEGVFHQRAERVLTTIRARFASAKQAVYGARALIEANQDITPDDWARYVWSVAPFLNEGVVGLGLVERIARDDIQALERRMHAEGVPSFRVERTGQNPWLDVVTRVAPAERNRGALGLDVGSGTTRRRATERAMLTGQAALSRRIRVIEGAREVPGFLLFLPVYAPGRPLTTPEQRTAALTGWVYASLRIDELTAGLADAGGPEIAFAIREEDSGTRGAASLRHGRIRRRRDVQPAGRPSTWKANAGTSTSGPAPPPTGSTPPCCRRPSSRVASSPRCWWACSASR